VDVDPSLVAGAFAQAGPDRPRSGEREWESWREGEWGIRRSGDKERKPLLKRHPSSCGRGAGGEGELAINQRSEVRDLNLILSLNLNLHSFEDQLK